METEVEAAMPGLPALKTVPQALPERFQTIPRPAKRHGIYKVLHVLKQI